MSGDSLHKARRSRVSVSGREDDVLLRVDTGVEGGQRFNHVELNNFDIRMQRYHLNAEAGVDQSYHDITSTLTSWPIMAVSQDTKTTLAPDSSSSMVKALA